MFRFYEQRLNARKIRLNTFDILDFSKVPNFIIDAFFGNINYKDRLFIATFCFLNGISSDRMEEILKRTHYHSIDPIKIAKLVYLHNDFRLGKYLDKYYSYNVIKGLVMYLNGTVKRKL